MPGYELTEEDKRNVPEKFLCIRCSLVLRKPMQLFCGHHVCAQCLEQWKREGRHRNTEGDWTIVQSLRCPSCDGEDILFEGEAFPDNFLRRDILQLRVKCLEHGCGCTWKGLLKSFEQHRHVCGYVKVTCECGMTLRRREHEIHSKEECEARLTPCDYCKTMTRLNQMQVHQSTHCQAYPTTCPKCNEPNIQRSKLQRHWDPELGNCEEAENHCPFEKFGCEKKEPMKRGAWRQHADLYLKRHLRLVAELLPRLATQETVDTVNRESERKFESLTEAVRDLQLDARRVDRQDRAFPEYSRRSGDPASPFRFLDGGCDANMNDLCCAVKYCMEMLQQQEQKIGVLGRNGRIRDEFTGELDERVEDLEARQAELARRSNGAIPSLPRVDSENQQNVEAELVGVHSPGSIYGGTLLWKIENVTHRRRDAVRGRNTPIHSPFFYTSRRGYKMCLRIHLDGDGSGRGSHISVFFVVMRGEHDEELRWPFRQEVTIKLLDQQGSRHVTTVFKPDPNSLSFQRPRADMNVASGSPRFCSLEQLSVNTYVKDDVMVLKAVVDTSDL